MKELRLQFQESEHIQLKAKSDRLGVSLKQLVHDRALGVSPEETPMGSAKMLGEQISQYRNVLNQIIRRETQAEVHLYEADIIRMEIMLTNIETMVADYTAQIIKVVKNDGDA